MSKNSKEFRNTSLRHRFWYLRSLNLTMSSNFIGPISCLFSQQVWSWEHESEFAGLWRREAGWWKGGRAGCNGGEVLVRVQPHTLIWKNHGKVGFDKYSENENISFCCFRKHGFLHDFDLEMQDSNAWQRRSGVDVLSFEARDECSWVRFWRVNHFLQVSFPILMLVLVLVLEGRVRHLLHSGEFSILVFVSPHSPPPANLSKAGQAWSTTETGNPRYLVFKSAENLVEG